ncbi:hypothetical protein [Paenibacillus dendritiformis]|uniref:hypothetical protein n=1 Tax=Paenibacillus dendritiformis TaxID=130049 RepID=UPI00387E0341
MKGFKYVCWDVDDANAQIYFKKSNEISILHYSELKKARGFYDDLDFPGIYFCRTQNDLLEWIKDCIEWEDPFALDIYEISPIGSVRKREYDNGRVAFVTESCFVRELKDDEIHLELIKLLESHYN